jgi:hypothetical protein
MHLEMADIATHLLSTAWRSVFDGALMLEVAGGEQDQPAEMLETAEPTIHALVDMELGSVMERSGIGANAAGVSGARHSAAVPASAFEASASRNPDDRPKPKPLA